MHPQFCVWYICCVGALRCRVEENMLRNCMGKKWILASLVVSLVSCVDVGKEGDTSEDTGATVVPSYCQNLNLSEKAFDVNGSTADFGQIAPDFTFNVLDGQTWTLSEQWTGCDNYIFINYYASNDYPVNLGAYTKIKDMLEMSPDNTHIFILAYPSAQGEDLSVLMSSLSDNFEGAYNMMDPEKASWWRNHIHFVVDDAWTADWIGAMNSAYYSPNQFVLWSFAIDSRQTIRETGNYCDPSTSWEQCPPIFVAYESIYFNFEQKREEFLASQQAAVINVFSQELVSDPSWAGARSVKEVTLPDSITMAGFDTMFLDLELECTGYPAGTECPAWDYIVNAYLCERDDLGTPDVDESEICTKELGRWITTYWRPGRWVHDATPLLAWIKDGGTRKIAFYSQQPYNVTLNLRFSNQNKGYVPVHIEEIYQGGGLDDFYNWGAYHDISQTEWRQWTRLPQQDIYAISSWESIDDSRSYSLSSERISIRNADATQENFTVVEHNSVEQYLVTIGNPDNSFGMDRYQRIDYAWTGNAENPLAICMTEREGDTRESANDATTHCLVDDPTNCVARADSSNWQTGCNFAAWTLLQSDTGNTTDVMGAWTEKRSQQFAVSQNAASNGRYGNKYSRWDWSLQGDTLYFCHSKENANRVDDMMPLLSSCQSDNPNTDTVDESLNCALTVDARDFDRGCLGGAWRSLDATGAHSNTPTPMPFGEFEEIWHADKLPLEFTPPAGITHVEIAGVISGHGFGADNLNCAEFCDHQHMFWVEGGTEHIKSHPEAGTMYGCADQVQNGTIPNQSGTWIYGRGGWCPGLEVPVWRADITNDVTMGVGNTLNYVGMVNGKIYYPSYTSGTFRPRIDMKSYIVYYQ